MSATAFDPEAKEANDFDTANTHLKFKVRPRCYRAIMLFYYHAIMLELYSNSTVGVTPGIRHLWLGMAL